MPGKRLSRASLRLAALLREMNPDVKLTPAVERALGKRPLAERSVNPVVKVIERKESDRA